MPGPLGLSPTLQSPYPLWADLQGFIPAPDPTGQDLWESAQLLLAVTGILSFIVVVINS